MTLLLTSFLCCCCCCWDVSSRSQSPQDRTPEKQQGRCVSSHWSMAPLEVRQCSDYFWWLQSYLSVCGCGVLLSLYSVFRDDSFDDENVTLSVFRLLCVFFLCVCLCLDGPFSSRSLLVVGCIACLPCLLFLFCLLFLVSFSSRKKDYSTQSRHTQKREGTIQEKVLTRNGSLRQPNDHIIIKSS